MRRRAIGRWKPRRRKSARGSASDSDKARHGLVCQCRLVLCFGKVRKDAPRPKQLFLVFLPFVLLVLFILLVLLVFFLPFLVMVLVVAFVEQDLVMILFGKRSERHRFTVCRFDRLALALTLVILIGVEQLVQPWQYLFDGR